MSFEENDYLVTLVSDDGEEIEFEEIAGINYNDGYYYLLVPTKPKEGEEDVVYVFKYEGDDDGSGDYYFVDDDETIDAVFDIYNKLVEDDEDNDSNN